MFRRAGRIRGDYGVISAPACASTRPIEISYVGRDQRWPPSTVSSRRSVCSRSSSFWRQQLRWSWWA